MGIAEATKNNFAYTSLVVSIFHGRTSMAQVLLTNTQMDIDSVGETGNTPLMFAALWGQREAVRLLLEAGADVAVANKHGDTALALAMKAGHREVAVLLREFGALV